MVKFTVEQIRQLMDLKHNIRNMSGANSLYPPTIMLHMPIVVLSSPMTLTEWACVLCSHCSCGPRWVPYAALSGTNECLLNRIRLLPLCLCVALQQGPIKPWSCDAT